MSLQDIKQELEVLGHTDLVIVLNSYEDYSKTNKRVKSNKGYNMYISYKHEGKQVFYDLYEANEDDLKEFIPKKDCTLFRLHSEKTGSWPIVCINIEKSIVYFLKDYDSDDKVWDNRGMKISYDISKLIK